MCWVPSDNNIQNDIIFKASENATAGESGLANLISIKLVSQLYEILVSQFFSFVSF